MFRNPIVFIVLVLAFIAQVEKSHAEFVNIGIVEHYHLKRFSFMPEEGVYNVFADGKKLIEVNKDELIFLIHNGNGITVKSTRINFGEFRKVYFIGKEVRNSFRISPIVPEKNIRNYCDNLKVTLKSTGMRLVNNVNLENYIAGVVQAEVGPHPAPEFFKLQAILCRTYALENLKKHEFEGFNLCDRVHCQAYYRKSDKKEIEMASKATEGLVIVDTEINLITAAFYSNCGGQTVNSEDVWQKPVYYLRSVNDPYCTSEPNARWTKKVEMEAWIQYLSRKAGGSGNLRYNTPDPFYQDQRKSHYPVGDADIPLKVIRKDWKLKSTFFSAIPNGKYVVLEGRGFGHGTGLCQEGAMKMASSGHSYPDILHFYYKNVHLVDLSALDFFRED